MLSRVAKARRAIGIMVIVLFAALLVTLALPIETWRTGDQGLTPLAFAPDRTALDIPRRVWIDTDAACGHARRTDPDDCFAIALIARHSGFRIVGISTVFGNAPRDIVDRTTGQLMTALSADVGDTPPVFSGSAAPLGKKTSESAPPAHGALIAALEEGPLTILALGPLTNIAAVLAIQPALAPRVGRLVAVMGRRRGHLFHPAEGVNAGILFGHGPVFRDFNFEMDRLAASQVVASNLPVTLIPYDAARGMEMTASDLDALTRAGGSSAWVAERARGWLDYWQRDIGRNGFYPFDLLAAAYLIDSQQVGCARVTIRVARDPTLFIPFWRPLALLVGQDGKSLEKTPDAGALYCGQIGAGLKERLMQRLSNR